MDADESGRLDVTEMLQMGEALNPRVSRAEAWELLMNLDLDGDGDVDIEEFVQGMTLILAGQSGDDQK
jgi:Ca2+-binding EF-hand superfamily protein